MRTQLSFSNLDEQSRTRCGRLIEELADRLEMKRLGRFDPDLVKLEARVERASKGDRWHVSLRLQIVSRVLAAREEGHDADSVIREAFSELEKQADRRLARIRGEDVWKRPARRARIGAPFPPAREEQERDRRALYFNLIEDHIDTIYNYIRRELTYLECRGAVPSGVLSIRDLVDAAILKGLEKFEARPDEFSVGDWLLKIAIETIDAEARAARHAIPENAASLEAAPPAPAEDPTVADQELSEFYQPDEELLLEDLVADESSSDPGEELEKRELRLVLHRALADLPTQWRHVLVCLDAEGMPAGRVAAVLNLTEAEVDRIAEAAHEYLYQRLIDAGHVHKAGGARCAHSDLAYELSRSSRIPIPLEDRERLAEAMAAEEQERDIEP